MMARPTASHVVHTARLLLRPPTLADLDPYVEIHEDPEVLPHLTRGGTLAGRVAGWRVLALLIGHWALRGYGQWTVIERVSGEVVGRVGLWHPEGWPGIEVSWVIRRSCWGHGYASEAAEAALAFGFEHLGAEELISLIRPGNTRSRRVAENLGGRFRELITLDGVPNDLYAYSRRPESTA